jgi:hypothetical protein
MLLPGRDLKDAYRALPPLGRRAPYVSISKPADLDATSLRGVRGIYAFAPFRCRTPAPGVEELFLAYDVEIDERTARCFSRVVNLGLQSHRPVFVSWFVNDHLVGIRLSDRSIADPEALRSTPARRFNLSWTGMTLDCLPESVEWLTVTRWTPLSVTALDPLWSLPALKHLRLINVEMTSLTKVAKSPSLATLEVQSTQTFKGFSSLKKLRSFHSNRPVCPPVTDLVASSSLRSLTLRSKAPPSDLAALGEATMLESLSLDFGDIHGLADIASLAFLRTMRDLNDLRIVGVNLTDRNVTPVDRLPKLKTIELSGSFGSGVRNLTKGKRGFKATIREVKAPSRCSKPFTPRLISGRWTIFEDAAVPLGVGNNYDAEKAVRRRMRAEAPQLSARIEFDCEADSFCATAGSKKDLLSLATLMRTMMKTRSPTRSPTRA